MNDETDLATMPNKAILIKCDNSSSAYDFLDLIQRLKDQYDFTWSIIDEEDDTSKK